MNWAADTTPVLFGLSAKGFGTMMIVAVCVFVGILYWRKSDRRVLFSLSALLAWGIFAFSHAMHERYLFPRPLPHPTTKRWRKKGADALRVSGPDAHGPSWVRMRATGGRINAELRRVPRGQRGGNGRDRVQTELRIVADGMCRA